MNKLTKKILFFACPLVLTALVTMGLHTKDGNMPVALAIKNKQQNIRWNEHAIDSAVSLLKEGNVVLRMGTGVHSRLLAQMNRHNKSYSHCGIVMIEGGYPFVYHSIGGEDNPDARLRRDSAKQFFSQAYNTAIAIVGYTFSPGQEHSLKNIVHNYYSKRPRFDLQFDMGTDDKLYCTEFVYKTITTATEDTAYLPTESVISRRFVGTDNLYVNSHASLVWQVKFK